MASKMATSARVQQWNFMEHHHLVGGIPTPLKNNSVGVIIPNIWKNMFQTTNQSFVIGTKIKT